MIRNESGHGILLISVPDPAVIPTLTRQAQAATAIPDRLAHRRTRQDQVQVPTPAHHQIPTALQEGQGRRGAALQQGQFLLPKSR